MKGIYLIAIAFLASWTVISAEESISVLEKEDECPKTDTCPPKLIFHESDCSKYYECNNGKKVLRKCTANLHFSKIWKGCVDPSVSECDKGSITDCKKNGDLLPHECECRQFYECKNNLKVLHHCPNGEHFSKKLRKCITGNSCNDDDIASPECVEGVYVPHECECNKYYLCKNNRRILRKCEEGSNFSNRAGTCVRGPCDDKPTVCDENTRKAHECDCSKYYSCVRIGLFNEWIHSECSSGHHFNKESQRCMPRIEAGCERNPGDCTNSKESWPHECDCRLYYRCLNNRKEILSCPWGKYFDKEELVCNYAENVRNTCRNRWDDWLTSK